MNKEELSRELYKTFFIVRDLKQEEKFKSLDYWEGYTKAVSKLAEIIKDDEHSKTN